MAKKRAGVDRISLTFRPALPPPRSLFPTLSRRVFPPATSSYYASLLDRRAGRRLRTYTTPPPPVFGRVEGYLDGGEITPLWGGQGGSYDGGWLQWEGEGSGISWFGCFDEGCWGLWLLVM